MKEDENSGIRFERMTQIMEHIGKKVDELEQTSKDILHRIEDLKGGRIAELEKNVAVMHERITLLQKIAYGLVGAVLLAVAGAVLAQVMP